MVLWGPRARSIVFFLEIGELLTSDACLSSALAAADTQPAVVVGYRLGRVLRRLAVLVGR